MKTKSETRNPKPETNSKSQSGNVQDFSSRCGLSFGDLEFGFVPNFGFRISDFGFSATTLWSHYGSRHRKLNQRVSRGEHGQKRAAFDGVVFAMTRAAIGMVKVPRTQDAVSDVQVTG